MVRRAAARVEAAVTAFERGLVVVLLAVMAGAVFLDALHRLFAAGEGRVERLLLALAPAGWAPGVRVVLGPLVLVSATFAIAYGAIRTRSPERGRRRATALAAVLTGGLVAATRLLVLALPNGLVWSQQMALCLLLWVALAGASLGAREHAHVTFELAGKLWPPRLRRTAEGAARAVAAAFCLLLALLAALHAHEHWLEWRSSGGQAGLFEAFRVPRWAIYGFLPLPFTVLALRFLVYGVRAPDPEDPPG